LGQYKGWNPDRAVEDYYDRIKTREKLYEPVEELTWPYIRIINVGEKILLNVCTVQSLLDLNCSPYYRKFKDIFRYGLYTFPLSKYLSDDEHSVKNSLLLDEYSQPLSHHLVRSCA
jgi:hypothetical protein